MRKKRRGSDEINLTPLLDVLFTVLFVVMLTSMQSEQSMQAQAVTKEEQVEELKGKVTSLESEAEGLSEQVSALEQEIELRDQLKNSEEIYTANAVILTMVNGSENGEHVLRLYKGSERLLEAELKMNSDQEGYIENWVETKIQKLVDKSRADLSKKTAVGENDVEIGKTQPVYIVFYLDESTIYWREESDPIIQSLRKLQENNKEVFYTIVRTREENNG